MYQNKIDKSLYTLHLTSEIPLLDLKTIIELLLSELIVYPLKMAQARLWLPGLAWVDTFLIGQNTT